MARKFTWTFSGKEFSVKVCPKSGALYFSDKEGHDFHVLLEDFISDALKRLPKEKPANHQSEPFKLTPYARRLLGA